MAQVTGLLQVVTTCGGCHEPMTDSRITHSYFNGGASADPLAYVSAEGGHMHLHGVSISRVDRLPRKGRLAALARKWAR